LASALLEERRGGDASLKKITFVKKRKYNLKINKTFLSEPDVKREDSKENFR
jgi:hypothetical protein